MANEKDVSLNLFIVLSRAFNSISTLAHRHIRQSAGLNPTEFGVLELLFHKGEQPLQQIGDKILISSGNITYVVDKLEQKGLLARRPCKDDRRVTFAALTDEGRRLMEDLFPKHTDIIREATDGLSADEKCLAAELLKKLGLAAEEKLK